MSHLWPNPTSLVHSIQYPKALIYWFWIKFYPFAPQSVWNWNVVPTCLNVIFTCLISHYLVIHTQEFSLLVKSVLYLQMTYLRNLFPHQTKVCLQHLRHIPSKDSWKCSPLFVQSHTHLAISSRSCNITCNAWHQMNCIMLSCVVYPLFLICGWEWGSIY